MRRILIANRGEVAIRIARAAADLGLETVAVYAEDDAASLHRLKADEAMALPGTGPRAYLDGQALIAVARQAGCDAIHPGYGFLSESAAFARLCAEAGLALVGPAPEALELFGDKARARAFAAERGVPVARGIAGGATLEQVREFQAALKAPMLIKAAAGGGGRGLRRVAPDEDPGEAYRLCGNEALAAFGDASLYAEAEFASARHVEVQIVSDGIVIRALSDRECSIQRRRQKLIEIAPALALGEELRSRLRRWAVDLATGARLVGLATFEFLVSGEDAVFIEANPRLQVEHTVTEEVTGLDLVQLQLRLAAGDSLGEQTAPERGHAIQLRVLASGGGAIARYEPPTGPGVRVDGAGYAGYAPSPTYDPLIAKLIVRADDLPTAVRRARRAAEEFVLEGVATNLPLLRALLERPELTSGEADTGFLERELEVLQARAAELAPVQVAAPVFEAPAGTQPVLSPLRATVAELHVEPGAQVRAGQTIAVLEAMKMQHVVGAPVAGLVVRLGAGVGATVDEGQPLAFIAPGAHAEHAVEVEAEDLERIRPDLAETRARYALTLDEHRPDAVARRRKTGQRTARENLDDLFDPGSFKEFGALAIAAQRRRRTLEDLQTSTPADGIVTGVGEVNGTLFDEGRSRCVALAYDYTVLAGTQGHFSHKKTDRALEFAERWKLPIVWYTEGGGGRPGDVDGADLSASSLDTTSFTGFARLSGLAPRIAINSGRCFAGNAVFFGCADVTIATRYSNIGLGGPAMIEGGGLGVFTPDEIGPSELLFANGVLDLLVEDEAAATAAAKHILGMFQGPLADWKAPDQRRLRQQIPENRVRAYDVRPVIETLADEGSWLELRGGYGRGMITGFLRIEGRPLGVIANDPRRLGGAIDSEAAEKGARFLQLCDAFGVPVLSLIDTPGFMVGPQSETTAAVRRGSRLFVTAASMSVPLFAVVLRKGYGLGAQAMAGGDFSAAATIVGWPTAEFGPMGLEGAVRLGYRKELEAEADTQARAALFETLVARMYERGKAISVAQVAEIDAVIDPAETRAWLVRGLKACPVPPAGGHKRRPFVDVW